jgi:hypothetical protein
MPSGEPSDEPSISIEPTAIPSEKPSLSIHPSLEPSIKPTLSSIPSGEPSDVPSSSIEPTLNEKVTQLSVPPETSADEFPESHHHRRAWETEMKEYMAALDAMSAHRCDNAFFNIKFGHNPFGITLATPSDMMHLFESGIVKCVCQTFVDSMSTDIRVRVDNLMETLVRSQRTTLSNSQNFLRTNFRRGTMRLTMPSSHHWPGMMFAFLLFLLTPTGAEICCSCFLDKDVEEPDYDWDSAPGFDLDNVYKLPILRQHVNHGNDIHHTVTRNSDNEVQDPGEVPPDDSSSNSSEAASAERRVTNNSKGPAPQYHEVQPSSVCIPA